MFSRFIHSVAYVRISFFKKKAEWYSIVGICQHILLIRSSDDGRLGYLHLLAIVKDAAMNEY